MVAKQMLSTIDSIEKVLRFVMPGFLFVLLYRMAYPPNSASPLGAIGNNELYIFIPFIGIAIYSVHRIVFEMLDFIIFNRITYGSLDRVAEHTRARFGEENRVLRDYMYYRWAIIHCSSIFAELLIFFSIFHENGTFFSKHSSPAFWVGIGLFVLCLFVYWRTREFTRKLFGNTDK